MAVLTTDRSIPPPFWPVDPRRLGKLGRSLWPRLVAGFIPSWEWGLEDIRGNPLRLALTGGATIDRRGLVCDAAGEGAEATLPEYLKLAWPVTLVWIGYKLGTPDTNSGTFGLTANNTNASPFLGHAIGVDGSLNLRCMWNDSAFNQAQLAEGYDSTRQVICGSVVMRPAAGSSNTNGVIQKNQSVAAGVLGGTAASASYGASALIAIGNYTGISRNSNIVTEAAYVFRGAFIEPFDMLADPFCLVRPEARRRATVRKPAGGGGGGSGARSFVAGFIG